MPRDSAVLYGVEMMKRSRKTTKYDSTIENLGNLEQKRVDNGGILKKCSIIDDYLKNIQYLCGVNAVIIIRKEV